MHILRNVNKNERLNEAITEYNKRNWSFIPLLGDHEPRHGKRAAVRWRSYQQRFPTADERDIWFEAFTSIGIVTGRLSQLAVLDFDSSDAFSDFIDHFPHLTETYTVETRRGSHLYFRVPATRETQSRKLNGMDWLHDGRYVVAPPSCIDGHTYTVSRDLPVRTLSQLDLDALHAYFDRQQPTTTIGQISESIVGAALDPHSLRAYYSAGAVPGNRNNRLFQTGLLARDGGISLTDAQNILADLHAQNRSQDEYEDKRLREARATLQSAYSRPPRPLALQTQLPNSLREGLMQQNLDCAVRVIEGLRHMGVMPDMLIDEDTINQLLNGIVGAYSVRKTLTATTTKGQGLFEHVISPPVPPSNPVHAATLTPDRLNNMQLLRRSKPKLIAIRGRKTRYYRMLSNVELSRALGVPLSLICDVLTLDDLRSAKAMRMALHRGLIARRPARYTSTWLAARLGVHRTTKNRYDRELPDLHKQPTYDRLTIGWHNLGEIPVGMPADGIFLEDQYAKRYPPRRDIACRLLKQGRPVYFVQQRANYYWVGSRFAVSKAQLTHDVGVSPRRGASYHAYWQHLDAQARQNARSGDFGASAIQTTQTPYKNARNGLNAPESSSTGRNLQPETPHPVYAFDVEQFKRRINALCDSPEQRASTRSVRRWIATYGRRAVQRAIWIVEQRSGLSNPPGFVASILRSEHKDKEYQRAMR